MAKKIESNEVRNQRLEDKSLTKPTLMNSFVYEVK